MSLFNTLNHSSKDEVDCDAVIKAAQQNHEDVDQKFKFTHAEIIYNSWAPLYQALQLGLPYDVIDALSSPAIMKSTMNDNVFCCTGPRAPLHYAIKYNASFDVIELLLHKDPDAARVKGWTPLHEACESNASVEMVRYLLEIWPNAARERVGDGYTPLCYAINQNASIDVIEMLLEVYPDAARYPLAELDDEYYDGDDDTALHMACNKNSISLEVVSALLSIWPDAVCHKNINNGETPLHRACANENATLEVVQVLLDCWLKEEENLTSHSVNSLFAYGIPDDAEGLLYYLSSLVDNDDPPADEIIRYFTDINWRNGVLLVINMHPAVIKTLEITTSTMADFLCKVGKCCSLTTMMELIQNEPDLLEGV
uniref:Ankyrin repeat protein n=1 Tax=Ditylum brightwellii TaxID=49249 RepID=A0A7S4S0K3_9STRA